MVATKHRTKSLNLLIFILPSDSECDSELAQFNLSVTKNPYASFICRQCDIDFTITALESYRKIASKPPISWITLESFVPGTICRGGWNRLGHIALIKSISTGRDANRATSIMTATIIQVGKRTAGVVKPREDGRALVFHATDPDFSTLDGSSFANRHAMQRAVERVAWLQESAQARPSRPSSQDKLRA
jgi:hypothetical protein